MQVSSNDRVGKVEIAADGDGLVSRAGTALLAELSDRLGLTKALSEALADTRERFGGHDPGHVVRDLALTLCDGGDCVSDLGALREQPDLFGRVASSATAWRAIERARGRLDDLRRARAKARERAWAAGAAPEEIVLDFDSHLITAHSDKEGATPTGSAALASTPCCAISTRPARRSRACCARVERARTPRLTTSRCSRSASSRSRRPHLDRPMLGLRRGDARVRRRPVRDRRPLLARLSDHRGGPRRHPRDRGIRLA